MVSPLDMFVARGAELPVVDNRLKTHQSFREVESQVERQADATTDVVVEDAPVIGQADDTQTQ